MGVDYEERVDFARLWDYRISRAKAALEASGCGAFPLFDFYNIHYTTQTWIEPPRHVRTFRFEDSAGGWSPLLSVVGPLQFDGRDVAAVLVEAVAVEPVDPCGGGHIDVPDGAPRLAGFDQFGLVQAVDRLGQRVVI
jgi:hypothetical protein